MSVLIPENVIKAAPDIRKYVYDRLTINSDNLFNLSNEARVSRCPGFIDPDMRLAKFSFLSGRHKNT